VERRSFLAGNEHALIEARIVDGLADPAKRLKPLPVPFVLIEKIPNRGVEELIHIAVLAASQFTLDSPLDLRGQVHVRGRSS
jgi:hypothetical protein